MDILISPHNDDDALFAAYTCLRYKPKIITVLRSFVEAGWSPPVFHQTRELESAAAAEVLGCEYEQWRYPDSNPHWEHVAMALARLEPKRVWAPLSEQGGHHHHNVLGMIAKKLWPQTVFYATYTYVGGKTTTEWKVEVKDGWEEIKRKAMACYASQARHPLTSPAFTTWEIDEYLS